MISNVCYCYDKEHEKRYFVSVSLLTFLSYHTIDMLSVSVMGFSFFLLPSWSALGFCIWCIPEIFFLFLCVWMINFAQLRLQQHHFSGCDVDWRSIWWQNDNDMMMQKTCTLFWRSCLVVLGYNGNNSLIFPTLVE